MALRILAVSKIVAGLAVLGLTDMTSAPALATVCGGAVLGLLSLFVEG